MIPPAIRRRCGAGRLFLALWVASACVSLQAQVQVSIGIERKEYLLYEPIEVKVQISNRSGEALDMQRMAGGEPWIDFMVSTPQNDTILHTDRPWSPPRLVLLAGQTRTLLFNLTSAFEVREPGRYRVAAIVAQDGQHYSSRTHHFSVIRGASVWEQSFIAPPDPDDPKRQPRPRQYALLAHRDNDRNMLYLRIQNEEAGLVFCTTSLGGLVNYGEPIARVDRRGNCNVLHQSGPRMYTYTQFSATGKRIKTRFFSNIASSPTMVVDGKDETEIVGGEEIFVDEKNRQTVVPTAPFGRKPDE